MFGEDFQFFIVVSDESSGGEGILATHQVKLNIMFLSPIDLPQLFPLPLSSRDELGTLLNTLGLVGTYVEVGVNRGHFAEKFLSQWTGAHYVAVDPWIDHMDEVMSDITYIKQEYSRSADMEEAISRLRPFDGRITVLRMTSTEAAVHFVTETVDVVFIDALHRYGAVMADMQVWWRTIKRGGLMFGHDYFLSVHGIVNIFTVQAAVHEFAKEMNVPVFTTGDGECWYIVKI